MLVSLNDMNLQSVNNDNDDKKILSNNILEYDKYKEDDIENLDIEEDIKSDSEDDIHLEDNNI